MASRKRVPEIRFKGFEGEWEERKYRDTFINIQNNTLSRAELNYVYGSAMNIHYGDVLIKFGEVLDIQKDEIPYISKATLANTFKSSELRNGDIIIADTAEDETVGKCTEVRNIGNKTVFSGLHTIPSRPIITFSSGFLGYFMNSSAFHGQLLRLMQGTKVSSISKTALQDTKINFPHNMGEQSQIGSFFQNLDALITQRQKKLEKLASIKKAMLEKMFPKDGADGPELRFKGCTGKWERRDIGSTITVTERPIDLHDNEHYELVTVRRRNEGVVSRGTLKGKEILVKNYYEVRESDYLISKRQVVHGGNGIVPKSLDKAIVSNEYLVVTGNQYITTDFLALLSRKPKMYRQFFLSSYGVDIEKLFFDVEDWKKRLIQVPSLPEQNMLTAYFSNLDSLISLQKRELDKLRNMKKACLSKMFV